MLITAGHYTCLLPNIPMSASIGPFVSQVFVTISTFPVAGRQWYHGIPQHLGMDQYLLIPFLVGWTFIYQLFWCSPGVQGFDPSPFLIFCGENPWKRWERAPFWGSHLFRQSHKLGKPWKVDDQVVATAHSYGKLPLKSLIYPAITWWIFP